MVIGRVTNEATRAALGGAVIAVESDPRITTFSEANGAFRLERVPRGEQVLIVDYTGLDQARVRVTVRPGETATAEAKLSAGIYKLEAFTVSTVREGQAAAISSQRAADNVKNVVATDAFGNVADTNLGNLLAKMPGIVGERDEVEIFQVSLRGMGADFNAVTVDGSRLAGATTRGSGRAFEIDKVSTAAIEAIEIVKAATPDMDADSIGGSINLKMKSSFDRVGRSFEYSLGTNIYYQRWSMLPSASFSYSDVYGRERRLGIMLTGSFNRTTGPRSAFRAAYTNPTLTGPAPMTDFQVAEDEIRYDRGAVSLKADYKLSNSASVFASVMYNNFRDIMDQHKIRVRRSTGTAVVSADDLVTDMTNAQSEYEMESRVRTVKTLRLSAGGQFNRSSNEVDYAIVHAPSVGFEKREDLSLRFNGVNYRVDRRGRVAFPSLVRTGGVDDANYDNGFTDSINKKDFHANDEITDAKINLKRSFATTWPTYLKTGARFRMQEKTQDRSQDVWTYVGPDGVRGRNTATGVNDDNLNRFKDDGHRHTAVDGMYPLLPWPNWRALHREREANPALFLQNITTSTQNMFVNDGRASEDIYSGYLQGNVKVGRFSALGGVRVEETNVSGTGPVTDTSQTDPLRRFGGKVTKSSSYVDLFPSLHLRYEPVRNTLMRASVSTGLTRPSFNELMPITTVDTAANRITQNNPDLTPQHATSLDLSLEHYLKPVGLLSVGVFQKEITDYIFSFTTLVPGGPNNGFNGLYEGFDFNTKTNGGWARVKGFEANYQQQFTFLPGWLGGFGAFANYTRVQVRGTFNGTTVIDKISGYTPTSANVGLSFIRSKITLRTQLNHTGERVMSTTTNPATRNYAVARDAVDFSAKYELNPRLGLFFDAFNVFNEKYVRYHGERQVHRTLDAQYFGVRLSAGVTGRF